VVNLDFVEKNRILGIGGWEFGGMGRVGERGSNLGMNLGSWGEMFEGNWVAGHSCALLRVSRAGTDLGVNLLDLLEGWGGDLGKMSYTVWGHGGGFRG